MNTHSRTRLSKCFKLATRCAASLSLMATALAAPPAAPASPKDATARTLTGSHPVRFSLDKAGYVTLVIEDAAGIASGI
jgi:hypothetical protein